MSDVETMPLANTPKRKRWRWIATLAALVFLLVAAVFFLTVQSKIPLDQLKAAPEAIQIDGTIYVLQTDLWRDFMPTVIEESFWDFFRRSRESGSHPLMVTVQIKAKDGSPIPAWITTDKLWIIKDDLDVREMVFSGEQRPPGEKVARHGPAWNTGVGVDVVVRIVAKGKEYLLRASQQKIKRTE